MAFQVRALLVGGGSLLVQCAQLLLQRGHAVAGVVSDADPVVRWARAEGIPVFPFGTDVAAVADHVSFDWLFSIANLRMLPEALWSRAAVGAANFHDGPLPAYAGLNTPVWALLARERSHAITWHAITAGIDEGDVYVTRPVAIDADETTFTLNSKCYEAGLAGFDDLVGLIEAGQAVPSPQPAGARRVYSRFDKPAAGGLLDPAQATDDLLLTIRALDHGPGYLNPVATPKIAIAGAVYAVTRGERVDEPVSALPGQVVSAASGSLAVATADGQVRLAVVDMEGRPAALDANLAGAFADRLDAASSEALRSDLEAMASHESAIRARWAAASPLLLDRASGPDVAAAGRSVEVPVPERLAATVGAVPALCAWVARTANGERATIWLADDAIAGAASRWPGHVAPSVPLTVGGDLAQSCAAFARTAGDSVADAVRRGPCAADLLLRSPGLKPLACEIGLRLTDGSGLEDGPMAGTRLTVVVGDGGRTVRVVAGAGCPADMLDGSASEIQAVLEAYDPTSERPLRELSLLSRADFDRIVHGWNVSQRDYDPTATIHRLVEGQVDRTPDAVAVVFEDRALTYAELDREANKVASTLIALGVGPDRPVGLHVRRSLDLVIGALGILKAGGAYVPLDPAYPADRLRLMVEDSGLTVLLSQRDLASAALGEDRTIVAIEDARNRPTFEARPSVPVTGHHLAYVIYTSGSTGRPKGVMLEHRNVANFFAGMDDRVPADSAAGQPVWLAVTSLSFDISVLELFWTLQRGFKVVVQGDRLRAEATESTSPRVPGSMDFSLYYWGNDGGPGSRKYHLLLEGARFADTHGFCAVWTPERHFHAFGGPYPNPAVTGAAVAAITRNLDIRAGSCVLPLHHTARVAEEWAVIDNLSNGRTGMAIASGWMPEDFVLRPENAPPNNRDAMLREIDVLRRLWRGEKVAFPLADGRMVDVVTQPRPVQPEASLWLTTAGNPETYRDAARLGLNVLTHLLGQSIEELADKVKLYRETLVECGRNPDDFRVTLLLHTFLADDREVARDLARGPMKEYLRSAAALIKQYAWAFPAFKKPQGAAKAMDIDLGVLTAEELDDILEFAFQRYFEDSGLFGTVEDALQRVEQLTAIGVTEIACLVDFGIAHDRVLTSLEPLARVVARTRKSASAQPEADYGIGAQIRRHGVTHVQCTPSMARMMLMNDDDRAALGQLRHLFIGGEALQGSLVEALRETTSATIENMYGPTETTIWSSTQPVRGGEAVVPLGRPIANTQLYVLDAAFQPVPPGRAGELYIGGAGVARGYLNRPDLTAERFLSDPFIPGNRMYRTGDLARFDGQGTLHFLGRADHQVKVRGFRIELGEIEAALGKHPAVAEAVVVTREDIPGDVRIVAYMRSRSPLPDESGLRAFLKDDLPDFMIPSLFLEVERFPLTPNAKVDRKALPSPDELRGTPAATAASPATETPSTSATLVAEGELAEHIAAAFKKYLGVQKVAPNDNFFTIGGHSLLAVQVHRDLKANVAPDIKIADIFRFPTVQGLASHLGNRDRAGSDLGRVADRAQLRRSALAGRRAP